MDVDELIRIIEKNIGFPIDDEKRDVIKAPPGPHQVVAGPGSGKTELLTILALKSIFADGCNPKSILITTFTEKGAKNLRDRIVRYADFLFQEYPELKKKIDMSGLRIGTLHSLCTKIMQEYRYEGYENYRLMDEVEHYLFVYDHSVLTKDNAKKRTYESIWENLPFVFSAFGRPYSRPSFLANGRYPSKADRTHAAITLFNRLTEDVIQIPRMKDAGDFWGLLAESYEQYLHEMERHNRCDFSTLQKKFLEFLDSPRAKNFIHGDGSPMHPGIDYVFVDEYQDTNPIQEKIYFKTAEKTKNLTIVGDDDQALYRFRGGTVDCIVTFDKACERCWNLKLPKTHRHYLISNYRSHENIVKYYNTYIRSFSVMKKPRARVEGKPEVVAKKSFSKDYPAVCVVGGKGPDEVAQKFARSIKDMLAHGVIKKPSQCVLLIYSVQDSPTLAGPFNQALSDAGITVYNPRAKTYLEQIEIQGVLGGFISIIDPDLEGLDEILDNNVKTHVRQWVANFEGIAESNSKLKEYVKKSIEKIQKMPLKSPLEATALEIFWRLLSYEPFHSWMENPTDRSYRMGMLTKLIDSYCAVPIWNKPGTNRGYLSTSSREDHPGQLSQIWLSNFYYSIIGLLAREGIGDPEDEEVIVPEDQFPIMTIHQSKGLEFDFVFVYRLNKKLGDSTAVLLEDALIPFREIPPEIRFTPTERNEQDLIRLYYVAYSRAKYALVHLVPTIQEGPTTGFISNSPAKFREFVTEVM